MSEIPLIDLQAQLERAEFIRNQIPAGGLFAGQNWRISPEPFALDRETFEELETLGRVLLQFYRAANLLYRQSVQGKQPAWISRWLDLGKAARILGIQRTSSLKNDLPRVFRPDLLLTAEGLRITELDSVPGGIGLTAWLNRTYTELGLSVVGGPNGMIDGFRSIFGDAPAVHIVVSEESATYRPEMLWLARELAKSGFPVEVRDTSPFEPHEGAGVYRFFELFDVPQVAVADFLFEAAARKRIQLTPPPKSYLEEKLLLALLWNRRLREFWRQELGGAFLDRLQKLVPYAWVLDPQPLPPHAAIPELNLSDWTELKRLSKKDRELILKVSGYSADAWGARGVHYGADLSVEEWAAAVDRALGEFETSPHVLQRYTWPRKVSCRWVDFESQKLVEDEGRVRLCPYYFISGDSEDQRASLGGVMATICPPDKKIIHGMRDAIILPCSA